MPKGIYKRNPNIKIGIWERTEEQKNKLRSLRKGLVPWNKGKKRPPFSEEWRRKMSESRRKREPYSEELKTKISESHKGSRNPAWRGGISPINRIIRRSKEMRIWREAVFKRDNYTCLHCGKRGELNADHIKPFAYFPELRFELSNGRTLCKPCHLKTDTWGYNKK